MSRANVRAERWLAGVAALGLALLFWWPALKHPEATGFGDWQMVHHNWEVGYVALTRFHEWPLWNPYFCGGITVFGNPESQHLSPLFLLSFVFGTTLAVKLFGVLHATLGLYGMYLFARERGSLPPSAAALAATVWGCSGFFAWHGAGGHATFLPFYFAPWVLWLFDRALTRPAYAIALAATLCLVLLEGGTYPFPYFALLLALDAASRLQSVAVAKQVARAVAISVPLTLLWGAVRLLPVRDALSRMPRLTDSVDAVSLGDLVEMFTARDHEWRYPGHVFVWPEYGTFIGWGALGLAVLGILVALFRQRYAIAAGLVLFGTLILGEHGSLSPWPLLHHLPVFDSLRVPSRFAVLLTFYLALCAGLALSELYALVARANRPAAELLCWLVAAAVTTDLFVVNLHTINRWTEAPIVREQLSDHFYLMPQRMIARYASLPELNVGVRGCYGGAMNWVISPALWGGDVAQVRVPDGNEVLSFERSINRVRLRVHANAPLRAVLNQNYDPDWQSSIGTLVNDQDRLAIELPAGELNIELRYAPRSLYWALGCFAAGCALALALYRRARRQSLARAALVTTLARRARELAR